MFLSPARRRCRRRYRRRRRRRSSSRHRASFHGAPQSVRRIPSRPSTGAPPSVDTLPTPAESESKRVCGVGGKIRGSSLQTSQLYAQTCVTNDTDARLEESEHDSRRLLATTRSERGRGIESGEFHRPFVPNPVPRFRGLRRPVLRIRETKRNHHDIGIGGGHARTECAHEKETRRGLAIDVGQRHAETTRTESLARPRGRSPGAVSARRTRTFFDMNE